MRFAGARIPYSPRWHPLPDHPEERKTAGAVVAAAVLAGLMAAAGGGGAAGSVGAALDATAGQSANVETTSSQEAARKGDETEAWRRIALQEIKKTLKQRLRCAVQSYGQVQQFFLRTPCNSLDEMLFVLGDTHGNIIVVSVVWVKMPSVDDADRLKTLEDTYRTGDVTPIATQVLQLGGIRFTAQHYASRVDGSLVVIAETEPVRGRLSTALLNDVAKVAVVLPPL